MKHNFLLVDDDRVSHFVNERLLRLCGSVQETHTAMNGRQALDFLLERVRSNQHLPDTILLDLDMPVMDGLEFIEAFNNLDIPDKEKIRIIILTASHYPEDVSKYKSLGVKKFLTKPITSEKIVKMIFA